MTQTPNPQTPTFHEVEPQQSNPKKRKMKPQLIDVDEVVDIETYSRKGTTSKDAISVEHYIIQREDIDLNRSLFDSVINLSDTEDDDDDIREVKFKPLKWFSKKPEREFGQCSSSTEHLLHAQLHEEVVVIAKNFVCEICCELKFEDESFNIKGCTHAYCSECMVSYVASKLQENVTVISCPNEKCCGVLEPEFCREILPKKVFERWGDALCESFILGLDKFYCPFKDCSAPLLDEYGDVVGQSECPHCSRLFCVQCKVAWHSGVGCDEFQALNKDEREREDIMLMKLAKSKNWQRCIRCKYYVERSEGCLYMKCRCGYAFCYHCGAEMKKHIAYCANCRH